MGTDIAAMRRDPKASAWADGDEHCREQVSIVTGGLPPQGPHSPHLASGGAGGGAWPPALGTALAAGPPPPEEGPPWRQSGLPRDSFTDREWRLDLTSPTVP